ncbi:hypothetical protein [Acinetobacter sp. ANC5681]|uniref:hypothetical protein n=1 Tax=Acinetobacter sp. ANC5681 TaxID=2929504 RepID=UPI00201AE381|nr:hypothetical protein [Acinetobacter sp. ANC5681]MCL5768534.1 hypothetical protein [Acinetobacter sp. ANC5681]MCL5768544.1 hypothetical protein [Acinetobacter sp. ANC5681]
MNKLIKYIFALLSFLFISINVNAATYTISQVAGSPQFNSADQACAYFKTRYAAAVSYQLTHSETWCELYDSFERLAIGTIVKDESCPTTVQTQAISVPGWTNWTIEQQESYLNKVKDTTVCYSGCKYKSPSLGGSSGSDLMHLTYGSPVKDAACPNTSDKPPTIPPDNSPTQSTCKNASGSDAYCTKPPSGCPSGYSQGSFNGQTICIKNSPNNPNPNDPNNDPKDPDDPNSGDLKGVIDAINNAKNELKSAIQSQANQISSAIQEQTTALKDSINNQTSAINTTLNNVKESITGSINAAKDSINSSINAAKDSINSSINATKDSINSSINAAKDSINSSIKNVTDALGITNSKLGDLNKTNTDIKENTKETNNKLDDLRASNQATNTKLDDVKKHLDDSNKVLSDIKKNGEDTNKAINDLKTSNDGIKDAIGQSNSKLGSIDANGKETNSKLDDMKKGQDEGNALLKEIKGVLSAIKTKLDEMSDWFKEENDLQDTPLETTEEDITQYQREDYFSFSGSCPFGSFSASIPLGIGSLNFGQDLTFFCTFASEARPYIIGLGYLLGLIYLFQWVRNGNA